MEEYQRQKSIIDQFITHSSSEEEVDINSQYMRHSINETKRDTLNQHNSKDRNHQNTTDFKKSKSGVRESLQGRTGREGAPSHAVREYRPTNVTTASSRTPERNLKEESKEDSTPQESAKNLFNEREFNELSSAFIQHLVGVGVCLENWRKKISKILEQLYIKYQHEGWAPQYNEILRISLKMYLFQLSDIQISSKNSFHNSILIEMCGNIVDLWLDKFNSDKLEEKNQEPQMVEGQPSVQMHLQSQNKSRQSLALQSKPQMQSNIEKRSPNRHMDHRIPEHTEFLNLVSSPPKSYRSSNKASTIEEQQAIVKRLQSPTISQLQKLRKQNEEMIESRGGQGNKSQRGVISKSFKGDQIETVEGGHTSINIPSLNMQTANLFRRDKSKTQRSQDSQSERFRSNSSTKSPRVRDPKLFDRLYEEAKAKKQFLEQIEEIKIMNEMRECTFVPTISALSPRINTSGSPKNFVLNTRSNNNNNINDSLESQSQTPALSSGRGSAMALHVDGGAAHIQAQLTSGDTISNLSAIDKTDTSHQHLSRDEFFHQLSRAGNKSQKISDLSKIKENQELSQCTFKPDIKSNKSLTRPSLTEESQRQSQQMQGLSPEGLSSPRQPVWLRLHQEHKEVLESKKQKEMLKQQEELSKCTFVPQIHSQKPAAIPSQKELEKENAITSPTTHQIQGKSSHLRLYEKHFDQLEKRNQREQLRIQKELQGCTFSPQRPQNSMTISQQVALKQSIHLRSSKKNQKSLTSPVNLNKNSASKPTQSQKYQQQSQAINLNLQSQEIMQKAQENHIKLYQSMRQLQNLQQSQLIQEEPQALKPQASASILQQQNLELASNLDMFNPQFESNAVQTEVSKQIEENVSPRKKALQQLNQKIAQVNQKMTQYQQKLGLTQQQL